MKQKFFKGDLVRIARKLPSTMSHFPAGRLAYVEGSYADLYGGRNKTDYALNVKGIGRVSWYPESVLTLIARGPGACPVCGAERG